LKKFKVTHSAYFNQPPYHVAFYRLR